MTSCSVEADSHHSEICLSLRGRLLFLYHAAIQHSSVHAQLQNIPEEKNITVMKLSLLHVETKSGASFKIIKKLSPRVFLKTQSFVSVLAFRSHGRIFITRKCIFCVDEDTFENGLQSRIF